MKIETANGVADRNFSKFSTELIKAVAVSVPLIAAAQPGAVLAALSASAPSIIDATIALYSVKGGTLGKAIWTITSSAFTLALAKIIATAPIARRPQGDELNVLINSMLTRARINVDEHPQEFSVDALYSPLKVAFLREAAKSLPHELSIFTLDCPIVDCRILFEQCVIEALAEIRNSKPELFAQLEAAMSGPFNTAIEKRKALGRHHDFIIRGFTQRPVFGQEDTGVTLEDLYVRQRALWNTKETKQSSGQPEEDINELHDNFFKDEVNKSQKYQFPLHIGDLHATVWSWLKKKESNDAIRVIAGGPGSGKSTFARALAIEAIDDAEYDVLFIPLQEIEATGTFLNRIENLFRNRTDLGLDRVESPLNWLGQRDPDGDSPSKPLLLICDGLDEIAPPGSSEATTVTADFIHALGSWLNSRNSAGLYVSAIVLGRTIAAQEAFRKLNIGHHALLRVGGLLPLTSSREWEAANRANCLVDKNDLSVLDQRHTFWQNWCKARDLQNNSLPVALQDDNDASQALKELTAEPLLLYLLLWTGYLSENWEKAADNRNHVYEAIFEQIYARKWGSDSNSRMLTNRERGGHVGTAEITSADFFLLQEALGLASWATGGRTVTEEAFKPMLKLYLDRDKYEDLADNLTASVKSVALQSYTRSVGGDNAGFEFVHKTIGEYLIARALACWLIRSTEFLGNRVSDGRCDDAATFLGKVYWRGSLSNEICRFFVDELRLRYSDEQVSRNLVESRFVPLASWVIKHGFPVHSTTTNSTDGSFLSLELAEHRTLDVFWTGFQAISRQAFPMEKIDDHRQKGDWHSGPLKLTWPSPYSFISLFSKLSSPNLIAENKRLAPFDYLDLQQQAATDFTFGAVSYAYNEVQQSVRPSAWLPISLMATNLSGVGFYGSNLSQANFRYANLTGSVLNRANLYFADLRGANLTKASLLRADLSRAQLAQSNMQECRLGHAKFYDADLRDARLNHAMLQSDLSAMHDDRSPAIFASADLSGADFSNARIENTVFLEANCNGTNFSGCKLDRAILINTNFEEAITDANFKQKQLLKSSPISTANRSRSKDDKRPIMIIYSPNDIQVVPYASEDVV